MIEDKNKQYVSCPVCGRVLMKGRGMCNIEVTCNKCNRVIAVTIEEERVIVFENKKAGQVRASVPRQNYDYVDCKNDPRLNRD